MRFDSGQLQLLSGRAEKGETLPLEPFEPGLRKSDEMPAYGDSVALDDPGAYALMLKNQAARLDSLSQVDDRLEAASSIYVWTKLGRRTSHTVAIGTAQLRFRLLLWHHSMHGQNSFAPFMFPVDETSAHPAFGSDKLARDQMYENAIVFFPSSENLAGNVTDAIFISESWVLRIPIPLAYSASDRTAFASGILPRTLDPNSPLNRYFAELEKNLYVVSSSTRPLERSFEPGVRLALRMNWRPLLVFWLAINAMAFGNPEPGDRSPHAVFSQR